MIELKNVKKIYNSKKSSSTVALDDINLKIGSRGMLFIVGKSGSGKSTLLNLLGGLDSLTSGEISINGKNISDFSKKQYDSYRNTYIGFVFQEFNILEQYNVYENIELALKLQNQPIKKSDIDTLLNKLGLNDLGNRKINELSGGQKQRVAIARALIKNPKIILADEPTGNLDKNSSEQIFNILSDISKQQLVIVVSHDMEAAKKYANRIIEIEDGKIVSDSNKIDEVETNEFELKKSKLPFSYSLKMALISLKTKPLKLFMTIILTAISLIFMGFTVNCAIFNRTRLVVNTMKDNNNYIYDVKKSDYGEQGSMMPLFLDDDDITEIKRITNAQINPIYALYDNEENLSFEFGPSDNNTSKYYQFFNYSNSYVEITDSRIIGNLIGREPSSDSEIVIHKYLADYMIKFGVMTIENNLFYPKDYNELVDSKQELKLGQNKVIITGIVDDDNSLFEEAKTSGFFSTSALEDYFYSNYQRKGYILYVKGFTEKAILTSNKEALLNKAVIREIEEFNGYEENLNSLKDEINIITATGINKISTLQKNEVILSYNTLKVLDRKIDSNFNNFLELHSDKTYNEALDEFKELYMRDYAEFLNLDLLIYPKDSSFLVNTKIEVVGISLDDNNYISNQYIEEYEPVLKKISAVKIFDNDIKNLTKSLNNLLYNGLFDADELTPGVYYNYNIDIEDSHSSLSNVMSIYNRLAIYILIVSLIFVLFTLLLFSNFISISISYCKKEIGILRALGSSTCDAIKIFGYESLIIGVVSWIVSIIGFYATCNWLNESMFENMYYTLNGIVVHPLVPLIMLIYTVVISLMITIISISRITNIHPIDAINNK